MAANSMLKSVGAGTQPCFTPFVTGNNSEVPPLSRTLAITASYNWRTSMVHFLGQPNLSIICHGPSLQTMSNALVNGGGVEVVRLLLGMQLMRSQNHVHSPAATSEAALTLWK